MVEKKEKKAGGKSWAHEGKSWPHHHPNPTSRKAEKMDFALISLSDSTFIIGMMMRMRT